jgi:hypothetical protein
MEQNEQSQTQPQDSGLAFPFPGMSFPANVTLPVNIMADTTDYYLLTRDKIENLKAGTDSDESTMFGFSLAVCLTVGGILIPLYVTGAPHTLLVPFLWAALFLFAVLSVYFFRRWRALKDKRETQFSDILSKSRTIVTLASASEPKPPFPS